MLLVVLSVGSWVLHGVDFARQFRFEVGGFVFVDDGALGQFVDDGNHFGQAFGGHGFVLEGSEVAQGVAHGFSIVAVLDSSGFAGADSFFC